MVRARYSSTLFAFVIRESSSIKGSLSLFDGCLFTFFFLEIVAAVLLHRLTVAPRRCSPPRRVARHLPTALETKARLERKINFKKFISRVDDD